MKVLDKIMKQHKKSEELTEVIKQLKMCGVEKIGPPEIIGDSTKIFHSGFWSKIAHEDQCYATVFYTLPNTDFRIKKLSHGAKLSNCYGSSCKRGKHNVIDGEKYYNFVKDLNLKIALPKGWKFIFPNFKGFAMDNSFDRDYSYYGEGTGFDLCESPSMAKADLDSKKLAKSVLGGVLGKKSHWVSSSKSTTGHRWLHLNEGKVLFPVYSPARIGRMYPEVKITTKKEFNYLNKNSESIQEESLVNIHCLELIALYPDKEVLNAAGRIYGELVSSFLTYHPNYQFKWTKAAEKYVYENYIKK